MQAWLLLDSGKLEPRRSHPKHRRLIVLPSSATTCKSAFNSNLIFLPDSLSKRVFLADSGASLCLTSLKPALLAQQGFEHVIETNGCPVFAEALRLDPDKLRTTKEEFRKLERAGIISRSDSPWASTLHMVKKSDGTWLPCGD